MFNYVKEIDGPLAIFRLRGVIGLEESATLRGAFWDCLNEADIHTLVLDLKELRGLSASSISLFVATKNTLKKRCAKFVLVGVSPLIRQTLEKYSLESYFDICHSPEDVKDRKPQAMPVQQEDPN